VFRQIREKSTFLGDETQRHESQYWKEVRLIKPRILAAKSLSPLKPSLYDVLCLSICNIHSFISRVVRALGQKQNWNSPSQLLI
jgi:hypothetical protein